MMEQGEVLIGDSTYLSLNINTMLAILTDWVNVNISGGPYKVTELDADDNDSQRLRIVQLPKPEKK